MDNNEEREYDYSSNSGDSGSGIFLTIRQLSIIIALFLFISIGFFIAGYFWGQKNIIETVTGNLERESFEDRVTSSIISFNDSSDDAATEEKTDEEKVESQEEVSKEEKTEKPAEVSLLVGAAESMQKQEEKKNTKPVVESDKNLVYRAQIAGGNKKAMIQLQQRLKKRGVTVEIRRRRGKTSAGKTIVWHQSVSEVFDNKAELEDLIEKIKRTEKLKDVNIVAVKKKG